jgi:hypothetical protein
MPLQARTGTGDGQLRTSLKDVSARFLFENLGSIFYGKDFDMMQVLEDNVRPSSISNTFTTLLALFNDAQGDKETIREFRARFEGHVGALYRILGTLLRLLPQWMGRNRRRQCHLRIWPRVFFVGTLGSAS